MNDSLLAYEQADAAARFATFAALFDPWTFRHVDDLGIEKGWHCWEAGAGGPSVPSWLCERVGAEGRVLATDIDLTGLADAPFEVRTHDVERDPAPEGEFDLVHARLLLMGLAERQRALATMVQALRPGGWLLVEHPDPDLQPLACLDETGPAQQLANKLRRALRELLVSRGTDTAYGRKQPRLLREAGLVGVRSDAYFPITAPDCATLEVLTARRVRSGLIAAGLATDEEIERHLANIAVGGIDLAAPPMISAWGRKPRRSAQ